MGKETITVTIDEQGAVVVVVAGHKGAGCKALTEALEKMLGAPGSKVMTPEYAQRPEKAVKQEAKR